MNKDFNIRHNQTPRGGGGGFSFILSYNKYTVYLRRFACWSSKCKKNLFVASCYQ